MNITTTRNVGQNKGTPRIWLEGNKLDQAGFTAGTKYTVDIKRENIVLSLDPEGLKKVSGKNITPEYRMPVIDMHNAGLADFLAGATQVNVNYQLGVITIKRIKPA